MLAGSSHFNQAGPSALITLAPHAANDTTTTIGIHLDHCRDLTEIEQCVRAGYSSVMVDGSHLPFEGCAAKININTELRQAYLADVVSVLPSVLAPHNSVALWRAGREAVTTAAVRSIHTLASSHQGVATTSRSAVPPDRQPLKEERTQYA